MTPYEVRQAIRAERFLENTSGYAPNFLQGNLAIVPRAMAADFLLFCQRNPKPCPVLAVSDPGVPQIPQLGKDLDIRTDIPGYRIFRNGICKGSVPNLKSVWRDDLVTFVLGCSFSFEEALQRTGVPVRHTNARRNVPMYITNLQTNAAGPFSGPIVVSMRAFSPSDAIKAIVLSERYPEAHGAPLHIGDPATIGIADINKPEFGDAPIIEPGDITVFWACGVTPQMAIQQAAPDLAVTHEPGFMLVTDLVAEGASIGL